MSVEIPPEVYPAARAVLARTPRPVVKEDADQILEAVIPLILTLMPRRIEVTEEMVTAALRARDDASDGGSYARMHASITAALAARRSVQ